MNEVPEWLLGLWAVTGFIFWCLVFVWTVGYAYEKLSSRGEA